MSELPTDETPTAEVAAEQPSMEPAPVEENNSSAPVAAETDVQPSAETVVPADENNSSAPVAAETDVQPPAEATAPADENVKKVSEDITPAPPNTEVPAVNGIEPKDPGVVVHHLENSRSQRLLWILEELEVPYTVKLYKRNAEMRAPKELKKVHALGKSPVITDGDVTIAESGAITEYLISKYGEKFRPTEAGKVDDIYFSHYAEGSLMPVLVYKFVFALIPKRSPAFLRPFLKPVFAAVTKKMVEPELRAHCELIESSLKKSKTGWLAGGDHPTSADFMMMFPVELLMARGEKFVGPKTKEYFKLIQERPAYKRGLEKGGKMKHPKL